MNKNYKMQARKQIQESKRTLTLKETIDTMIDQFLINSRCITKREGKKFLLKLFGYKRLFTTLLYSGSIHGWMNEDFHSRCGNKGSTIVLFKIKDGDCIGGYTDYHWCSGDTRSSDDYEDDGTVHDSNAMLFNLSSKTHFPN